jgi:hypothetical protein
LHVPQLETERNTPQLSAPVNVPHALPSREQKAELDSGVQPHTPAVPPPPHVCGRVQLGQPTDWPQLLTTVPHLLPWQVVAELCGVQPHTPLTPPPPQVWPVPAHDVEHCTVWLQLLVVGPHLAFAHVVAIASSVQALQSPLEELQP